MSVAESARHGDRRDRTDSLNRVDNRRVREPGNVSDRTELTVAEVQCRANYPRHPNAKAAGGKTQTRERRQSAIEKEPSGR